MNPWWNIQIPLPVLLAAAATVGYLVGRWRRSGEICPQCKQRQAATSESNPKADGLQKV